MNMLTKPNLPFWREKTYTEANVRFEICYLLRELDIEFSLEYKLTKFEVDRRGCKRGCIFDIVIVRNNEIIGIIEVKRSASRPVEKTTQIVRYEHFGVPVFRVCGMPDVGAAVEFAKAL